jgi:hypothetical protein
MVSTIGASAARRAVSGVEPVQYGERSLDLLDGKVEHCARRRGGALQQLLADRWFQELAHYAVPERLLQLTATCRQHS